MNVFDADRAEIAGKLAAGGVQAVTVDPRSQVPCVLVELPRGFGGDTRQGIGGWQVETHVHLIAAPPGDLDATTWLLDQLEAVLVVYPGAEFEPTTVTRNDADCPAYLIRLTRSITSPNC